MKAAATYDISVDGRTHRVVVRRETELPNGGLYYISVDGGPERKVDAARPVPDVLALLIDDASWEAGLVPTDEGYDVELMGIRHTMSIADPKKKALRLAGGASASAVTTAMPGRVVRVLVAEGEQVKKGQPIVVVEAMKMENELKAPHDGAVRRVLVKEGALVESKAVLVELGPADSK